MSRSLAQLFLLPWMRFVIFHKILKFFRHLVPFTAHHQLKNGHQEQTGENRKVYLPRMATSDFSGPRERTDQLFSARLMNEGSPSTAI